MSTSEYSSNWDFTPVIELLHSFRVGGQPDPCHSATPANGAHFQHVSSRHTDDELNNAGDYPRLGDFTAVWDYLSQKSPHRQNDVVCRRERSDEPGNIGLEDVAEAAAPQDAKVRLRKSTSTNGSEDTLVVSTRPKVVLTRPPIEPNGVPSSEANDLALDRQKLDCLVSPKTPRNRKGGYRTPVSESKPQCKVRSVLTGQADDKKLELISQLRERFPNERKVLRHPDLSDPAFALSNTSDKGIHVFVDISNIMVGFHDCIKTARNIPIAARVPRLPLSFHNLSLVLERGRGVRKRILVGSDRFPAIDEAERLGYEVNVLDRVQKARDTPRKKKFANGDRMNGGKSPGNRVQDERSGPETTDAGPQLQRWVEQAVDEVLHLKMLESLVDTTEPSTIVLATGDAAEAEYSEGFMRMVERALEKGWRVELISFGSTMSQAYIRKHFRSKWSSRFVVILLDTYSEYLLDM